MSRVVACQQCAAPHQLATGQTRFTCDWCGGLNHGDASTSVEELVLLPLPDPRTARARVFDEAQALGWTVRAVTVGELEWTAAWQVVNEEGEVWSADALEGAAKEPLLPAGTLLPRHDLGANAPPSSRRAAQDVEEAVAAARANFEASDASVRSVRLIWVPWRPLRVRTLGGVRRLRYSGGVGHLVHTRGLSADGRHPLHSTRLLIFCSVAALAFVSGVAVSDPWTRGLVLAALFATSWSLWSVLHRLRTGGAA